MSEWILEPIPKSDFPRWNDPQLEHLDGVPWFEAPVPRRLHRCTAQTRGYIGFDPIERCACGAIRRNGARFWLERNSSERDRETPTESYIVRKQRQVDQQNEWRLRLREMRKAQ